MLDLFRKYRTPLLAGCLLLAALLLYTYQIRQRQQTSLFHKGLVQLTAPFQKIIDVSVKALADGWDHYLWLVDTARDNDQLRRDNNRLQADLDALSETRLANERLRLLLEFKEQIELPVLPAQVIGEDASSWFRTVVIDKGSQHGVTEGLPVVVAEGVVGQTIQVAPFHSRVLLVTDASSAAAVLVQPTRSRAICRGKGNHLVLDYALRNDPVNVGDPVVTSGMGGIYPKGLRVGLVSEVSRGEFGLFQAVVVTPSVDFSRLEEVLVLLKGEP
jgi:rod shape-determining protein MreC